MNRRNFLHNSSVFVGGTLLFPHLLKARGISPSDKINLGVIGFKGMGWANTQAILKNPEVRLVALCDVDQSVINEKMKELEKENIKPAIYADYRKMLDDKNVDVVIIGTPDHWHCKMMVDACAAGKAVYCEKPAGNSITECDIMVAAQERYKSIVQVGQWQRSSVHFETAMNFVHSGQLGNIRLVKAWAYQGWMKSIPVKADAPVPPGVNYDMWLGPAKKRAFNPNRFHFNFRWYWDYGGGLMTDWGVHLIDYALIGSKASLPKSIVASGGKFAFPDDAAETPDTLTTVYEFDKFNLQWEHATGINDGPYARTHGVAFIGNNGTLVLDRNGWEVIPEIINDKEKMEAVPYKKSDSYSGLDVHMQNLVAVIKSGKTEDLKCPIRAAAHVATVCNMGNVAYRTGKKIYWNESLKRFTDKEANKYLTPIYYNGFTLPKI